MKKIIAIASLFLAASATAQSVDKNVYLNCELTAQSFSEAGVTLFATAMDKKLTLSEELAVTVYRDVMGDTIRAIAVSKTSLANAEYIEVYAKQYERFFRTQYKKVLSVDPDQSYNIVFKDCINNNS